MNIKTTMKEYAAKRTAHVNMDNAIDDIMDDFMM